MTPQVYHAIQRFEREAQARCPEIKLKLIEPLAGADASFLATFPTLNWYKGLNKLNEIMMDIEEETDIFFTILAEVIEPTTSVS